MNVTEVISWEEAVAEVAAALEVLVEAEVLVDLVALDVLQEVLQVLVIDRQDPRVLTDIEHHQE